MLILTRQPHRMTLGIVQIKQKNDNKEISLDPILSSCVPLLLWFTLSLREHFTTRLVLVEQIL